MSCLTLDCLQCSEFRYEVRARIVQGAKELRLAWRRCWGETSSTVEKCGTETDLGQGLSRVSEGFAGAEADRPSWGSERCRCGKVFQRRWSWGSWSSLSLFLLFHPFSQCYLGRAWHLDYSFVLTPMVLHTCCILQNVIIMVQSTFITLGASSLTDTSQLFLFPVILQVFDLSCCSSHLKCSASLKDLC